MPDAGPRRIPLLQRLVGAPAPRRAAVVVLLLVVLTGAASALVPGPLALAPAATAAVLAGLWCSRGWQLLLPPVLGAALLAGPALPDNVALVSAAAAAAALAAACRVVAVCVAAAASSQTDALRTAVARDDEVRAAQQSQQELVGQLHYWSTHDALTGLLNRSAFLRTVESTLGAGHAAGVLVVSLAGFTAVNEQHGDGFGDAVLGELARRLVATARSGDLVARLGGDSFGVLLLDLSERDATGAATRLVAPLGEPYTAGDVTVALRVRSGVAVLDEGAAADGRSLLRAAEAAGRRATAGQPPVVVSGATPASAPESGLAEADLARALQAEELFLLYQPLVCGDTGRIRSVEALVRWQHPERGLVPPDAFIGLAERTGLIVPLGLQVLELACTQLQVFAPQAPYLTVAVNVSVRQLVEPGFVDEVRRVLWSSRVDPSRLILELTESMLVDDSESAVDVLWKLRSLGVRLALDDFGTGYSSLARLGDLPLDEMKIDKSFVDRLGALPQDSATLVTAAIAMGHGLGLEVVAEGVETAAQASFLRELGCDLLQGYLMGRPQPAAEVMRQLGHALLPPPGAIPAPRPEADRMVVPGLMPSLEPRRRS